MEKRKLYEIAKEIKADWTNIDEYALAYLEPMFELSSIDDKYYLDTGKSVVLYFLANAQTWRGETAKRVKAELKEMAGI
mgnify:CR=1 FL=1|tara:strand:- start:187 stop:423 length:237 start_codon:yes stop_codon:yes gene_type:complete